MCRPTESPAAAALRTCLPLHQDEELAKSARYSNHFRSADWAERFGAATVPASSRTVSCRRWPMLVLGKQMGAEHVVLMLHDSFFFFFFRCGDSDRRSHAWMEDGATVNTGALCRQRTGYCFADDTFVSLRSVVVQGAPATTWPEQEP